MVVLARSIQLQALRCIGLVAVGVLGIPLAVTEALAVAVEELEPVADLTVQAVALH